MKRLYVDITDICIPSDDNNYDELVEFADAIAEQETIEDVAPVRHGRWAEKGTITDEKAEVITEWQSARCTCCNKYHTTPYLYYFDNFAYCPNCGAKMDEGGSDGTDD